ncbi:hypothetical protein ES705_49115 [subsurface metagenome]
MKALSLRQPYASFIAIGRKTIETRTWSTNYRGPLLIVSSKGKIYKDVPHAGLFNLKFPFGMALATVDLICCRPMTKADVKAAMYPYHPGLYAWVLSNIKKIDPFPVKGQLKLFEVDYNDKK